MKFEQGKVQNFLEIFMKSAEQIRNFPGCLHLELLQVRDFPEILLTYSIWESAEKLDEYRHSELFNITWRQTKALFSAPAEAWSLDKLWP
jgi:quinol monooxygenase YgiN